MTKPDYSYLIKLDNWSKKDASLIISGLNPDNYRSIRFIPKDLDFKLYPELQEAYQLYKLFLSMNLYEYGRHQGHPLTYITECLNRDWPLPDELLDVAKLRYMRETGKSLLTDKEASDEIIESDAAIAKKEKNYLLKSLAVMALLYVSKQNTPRLGTVENINISQVTEDILQFLEDQNLKIYGIGKSSLNKRIAEGLRSLFRE